MVQSGWLALVDCGVCICIILLASWDGMVGYLSRLLTLWLCILCCWVVIWLLCDVSFGWV